MRIACWSWSLALVLWAPFAVAQKFVPTVLISFDGVMAKQVLDNTRGLRLEHLRSFLEDGSYATGVVPSWPSLTYPSHTSIITGTTPSVHGIDANINIENEQARTNGWNWFSAAIGAETLWAWFKNQGARVGNLEWPVSLGLEIDYNVPQYFSHTPNTGRQLLALHSTPGLLAQLESYADGASYPMGYTMGDDQLRRAAFGGFLKASQFDFVTLYMSSVDEISHEFGPNSDEAGRALEALDVTLGHYIQCLQERFGNRFNIFVVSDHGFSPVSAELDMNHFLAEQGLLTYSPDGSQVISWQAYAHGKGGSVGIVLRDPSPAIRQKVGAAIEAAQRQYPKVIAQVLNRDDLQGKGFPHAYMALNANRGYMFGIRKLAEGAYGPSPYKGVHGYLDGEDMDALYLARGPRVHAGALGRIPMTKIADFIKAAALTQGGGR